PVVVLDVLGCRALSFEHVILVGLSERGFPQLRRRRPFYDERRREEMIEKGIHLPGAGEAEEQELLLFYLAVTRARRTLTLSYPSADAGGHQVLPSQFLDELEALFAPDGGGVQKNIVPLDDLALPLSEVRSTREARHWLFANLWAAGRTEHPALSEHLLHHLYKTDAVTRAAMAGLAAERERELGEEFGPLDGVLAEERIIRQLKQQYPGARSMSASRLEAFGQCPWRFFARYIMRLKPRDEPGEELGPLDVGAIYHELLRRFFTALRSSSAGTRITPDSRDAALAVLHREADGYFDHLQSTGRIGSRVLWKVQRDEILANLRALVDWQIANPDKFGPGMAPAYFEAEFGQQREFRDTEVSTTEALALEGPHGTVLVQGRIDRVDVAGDDGSVGAFAVIDYKSGGVPRKKWMSEGMSFQLPLYLRAFTELLMPEARAAQATACFFTLREPGPKNVLTRFKADGSESDYYVSVMQSMEDFLHRWVGLIRDGVFAVLPRGGCGLCEFADICRYVRWRIDAKQTPKGLEPTEAGEDEDGQT
ncbi:MAG: PD-(D/E)XK nuclease family protein, partial [Planctomycetia bacterium]|nr:PD-(D/E)XK nuclease family protein [Planctomycetia bacterium]